MRTRVACPQIPVAFPRIAGQPSVVFETAELLNYDVTPDGERFLVIERNPDATPTELLVMVNWFEELNRLVPPN